MSTSIQAQTDTGQSSTDPSSSTLVSDLILGKSLLFSTSFFFSAIYQLTQPQEMILKFLRHLLPIVSSPQSSSGSGYLMKKVKSSLDYYLPFRQHAPSLINA